jgi:sulfide dehydrogenase cytochrome subunit
MIHKRPLTLSVLWAVGLLFGQAALAAPSNSMLANACAGCHGTNGLSSSPMPIIAQLDADYLKKVMKQYKNDERPSTIMGRLTKGYTDEQLDGIAAFFSSQTWVSPQQELDRNMVRKGSGLHREQCEMCHQDGGRYMDGEIPRLAGQWRRYLEIAMEEYKDPQRKMPDETMTMIMTDLEPEQIRALAYFYASQR